MSQRKVHKQRASGRSYTERRRRHSDRPRKYFSRDVLPTSTSQGTTVASSPDSVGETLADKDSVIEQLARANLELTQVVAALQPQPTDDTCAARTAKYAQFISLKATRTSKVHAFIVARAGSISNYVTALTTPHQTQKALLSSVQVLCDLLVGEIFETKARKQWVGHTSRRKPNLTIAEATTVAKEKFSA